ncbi:AraC family transcriptional regulator [Streptomyces sp. NPDC050516]|uniref:AraC family transcriptional regulator n=1 Tax=Streptomyces sp. NPDC050516 TaxID=3365621 RepID=UPI00379E7E7E
MAKPTITVHHVRAVLRGAERHGIDTVPLLQASGIPPLLLGDDRARVTPAQFAQLFRALYRATGDEFLGLGGAPSRPGTFAMMCYAVLGCRDLGGAMRRGTTFYGLFAHGPDLTLDITGPEAVFAVRGDLMGRDEDRFLTECLVIIWHRLCSWLVGRRIPLTRAAFGYPPPPHKNEYESLFGCPVRFGDTRTEAVFDAHWLTAPLVRDEAALAQMLRRSPFELLSRHAYGTTVGEQVGRALSGALRASPRLPTLEETAARLAMSPATLRRRLAREGTSFQQLKDAVRRDAAIAGLAEGREPIAEIAARLGFSEDTSFHRAFRRWTGTTPGSYRLGR